MLPLLGIGIGLIAWRGSRGMQLFTLQFLGVLAACSIFKDLDYLGPKRHCGRPAHAIEHGAMEAELLLPALDLGHHLVCLSGLMIGASLKYALNHEGHR